MCKGSKCDVLQVTNFTQKMTWGIIWCCVKCDERGWFWWQPERPPVWKWDAGGCWGLSGEPCCCGHCGCHNLSSIVDALSAWEWPADGLNGSPTGRNKWGKPQQGVTEKQWGKVKSWILINVTFTPLSAKNTKCMSTGYTYKPVYAGFFQFAV